MNSMIQSLWTGALRPLLKRPPALQVAALCHRDGDEGVEVLLVTSSSGRWILPKGWPIDGMSAGEAAKQEAWEEGGVRKGRLAGVALGSFLTEKRFDNGSVIPCEIRVYPIDAKSVLDDFPEAHKRDRKWVPIREAANLVDEPGLREMLESFAAA